VDAGRRGAAGAVAKPSVQPTNRRNQRFLLTLGGIAVVGIATLGYCYAAQAPPAAIVLDPNLPPVPSEPYVMGSDSAPVDIDEYADFECPTCGAFAQLDEADIRERLVKTGKARFRMFDFPIEQHLNTLFAHNAAACAADQGKFWEMHDSLFAGQVKWNGQATRNPKPIFVRYVRSLGLDETRWETCYDTHQHQARIKANQTEGVRRGVGQTPSFVVGDRLLVGIQPFDVMKAFVDSATARKAAAKASPKPPPSDSGKGRRGGGR
jgi:protein-disulfide isomerase